MIVGVVKNSSQSISSRFKGGNKGQFVILAAIIIAAFMFPLVITISQLSTMRYEVPYEPVDELVLAITSDFERCLAKALAIATQNYSETWSLTSAENTGEEFVDAWRRAVIESYGGLGINIRLMIKNAPGKSVYCNMMWGDNYGESVIYTTFDMDIEAYGLKGLTITMQKKVSLKILNAKMEFSNEDTRILMVFQAKLLLPSSKYRPISDLTQDSLELLINGTKYREYDIIDFKYLGMGNYSVTFRFSESRLTAENITLIVTTRDGIKVAATQELCILMLQSDDPLTEGIIENNGMFNIKMNGFEKTCSPPYTMSLFPGQTINVSFNPPENAVFLDFSSSRSDINLTQDGTTALVTILSHGWADITARYNMTNEPPSRVFLNLSSREEGDRSMYKGIVELTFPNGSTVSYTLPIDYIEVPYDESITIRYYPDYGYVFKYWEVSTAIKIEGNSPETVFKASGNGSITAVYAPSKPKDWQKIYISPERPLTPGGSNKNFTLVLYPPQNYTHIAPPLNNKWDNRSGNTTETTPTLMLDDNIVITLYAKYTKGGKQDYIDVNVKLGFFASDGTFFEIGNDTIRVSKSSGYLVYKITFEPKVNVVPEGSILTLTFTRMDDDQGGTFQIECSPEQPSVIELWQY